LTGLVLHSYRRCPFAIRVRMVLEEKALPHRIVEESLSDFSPELLAQLAHAGAGAEPRVPLLLHDGVALHESAIITEYLDELQPEPALAPADPLGRARMRLWTRWCDERFKPDLDAFKYEWGELAAPARGELLTRMRAHLARIEAALALGPWLLGERLTLADVHVFPFYRQLTRARPEYDALLGAASGAGPRAGEWLARIEARPSFARVMRKPGT
jgi:glutathione S-transferase